MRQTLKDRIEAALTDSMVKATYRVDDESVQAEVRMGARWKIHFPVYHINYPRYLAGYASDQALWMEMGRLVREINEAALLKDNSHAAVLKINARTKSGPERRAKAKADFEVEAGRAFLADYKAATDKLRLRSARRVITALQEQQKRLLPLLRKVNSEYLAQRKKAKTERDARNTEALISGRFWEADKEALKGYFSPPFGRNYLADVSERWRAALYTEMASTAWKAGKGDWRHKNIGTGRGYLCGIDDNGDEWGHHVNLEGWLNSDEYGDYGYVARVEEAMSSLFGCPIGDLNECERQGDLLFCPSSIPEVDRHICGYCGHSWRPTREGYCEWCSYHAARTIKAPSLVLADKGLWEIRESHRVESDGLQHNGEYFRSANPIKIAHTSHPAVILPPGEYRIYASGAADAD